MKRTLLTLLSIFCIATTVYSQTVWEDKVAIDTDTGNNPYTIANGLIDGDSNLDILVGTDEDNVIVWYKGNVQYGSFTKNNFKLLLIYMSKLMPKMEINYKNKDVIEQQQKKI